MGFNHKVAGFDDVESMVTAMQQSEDAQLAAVAKAYNGAAYAKNKYDARLAGAFEGYAAGVLPDIDVRRAQLYLTYLGVDPGGVEGVHGKRSRSAVAQFRLDNGLGSGDRVDKLVLAALQAKVSAL